MGSHRDIVVIGGGIVGCATVYNLALQKQDVVLLERTRPGFEASGRNTGTLNPLVHNLQDLSYRMAAYAIWRTLSDELDYDLELEMSGSVRVAETAAEFDRLKSQVSDLKAGGCRVEVLDAHSLRDFAPYIVKSAAGALYSPDGWQVNPREVCFAYMAAAARLGASWEQAEVVAIVRNGGGYDVVTRTGRISAARVVLAAGPWSVDLARALGVELPIFPRYFQALVTARVAPFLHHIITRVANMITIKQNRNGNCVIGGGWMGDSAFPDHGRIRIDQMQENLKIAVSLVPELARVPLLRSWAGYDGTGPDSMPIIAEAPGWPGVFISTGARAGFSCGPIWGELTCDMMLGRRMRWDRTLFTLDRFEPARRQAS